MQHERDVLDKKPTRARIPLRKKTEHLVHQTRFTSVDARCAARLTEVLTRKSCCNDFRLGKRSEVANVSHEWRVGEVVRQNALRGAVEFAQQLGLVPSSM